MVRTAINNLFFVAVTILFAALVVCGVRMGGISFAMLCPWYLAVIPVVGICGGGASFLMYALLACSRMVRLGYLSTYGLPTLCSSLYFKHSYVLVRIVLPLSCMALFIAHPVGQEAAWYSAYWIIPVAVALINPRHFFYQALGSTFIAHAVGSVITLYTVGHTAQYWLALIPVVCVERIVAASLATAAYMVICAVRVIVSKRHAVVAMVGGRYASH